MLWVLEAPKTRESSGWCILPLKFFCGFSSSAHSAPWGALLISESDSAALAHYFPQSCRLRTGMDRITPRSLYQCLRLATVRLAIKRHRALSFSCPRTGP